MTSVSSLHIVKAQPPDLIAKSLFEQGIQKYSASPEEHLLLIIKVINVWPSVHSTYSTHDFQSCSFKTCYNGV